MGKHMSWVVVLTVMVVWVGVARGIEADPAAKTAIGEPRIEVVFVLDTTGSMSGLIEGAKQKIWAIANTIASAEPTPDVRMGLVGYRDRGDQYVTRLTQLTGDIDAVYARLMEFKATGGGDTPESVNQALYEAVTKVKWSKDDSVYKVIYLVGDCPPHMDYKDDVEYPKSCELAAKAGIVINTVQCGTHGATTPIWQKIALLAEGKYFAIAQSGGMRVVETPYDAELARLSRELDSTRVAYGLGDERAEAEERYRKSDRLYETASSVAVAQRAAFNASKAGKVNFAGFQELVVDIESGRVELAKLKREELPENMQKMSSEEREAYVKEMAARRADITGQIKQLDQKRQVHITAENKKLGPRDSFDKAVFESIREQARKKGILITGENKG